MGEKQSVLFLQSLYREAVDCNVFAGILALLNLKAI
jgi:hypothetical protein